MYPLGQYGAVGNFWAFGAFGFGATLTFYDFEDFAVVLAGPLAYFAVFLAGPLADLAVTVLPVGLAGFFDVFDFLGIVFATLVFDLLVILGVAFAATVFLAGVTLLLLFFAICSLLDNALLFYSWN